MIIGITGSIGSGKTAVAKLFSRHWYNRIDADEIAHYLLENNRNIKNKIIKNFGEKILDRQKNIYRKKLGEIVFNSDKKLKKLNSIMHPSIIQEIKSQIKKIHKKCGSETKIAIDAPLLLETNAKNLVDKVIVVKCDKKNIINRLNKKYPKEKIEKILNAQMPLKEKLKHADFIIDNNKDLKNLEKQVKIIIKKLN